MKPTENEQQNNDMEEKIISMESQAQSQDSISPSEKELRDERMRKIMMDYHSGSTALKNLAVEQMLKEMEGFIGHMIKKHFAAFATECYSDLYNEGVIAILEYMDKFNPDYGTATTYFTRPILHAMSAYVNQITNKSTAYYSAIMNKIRNAVSYFESQEIQPSLSDIAFHTGLSVKKVEEGLKRINAANEYHYTSDAELDSVLQHQTNNPEEDLLEKERNESIGRALGKLGDVDKKIILLRFGFDDGKSKSYSTIAKLVKLPINQVSNSINRSLRILRENPELRAYSTGSALKHKEEVLNNMEITLVPDMEAINIYAELGIDESSAIMRNDEKEDDSGKEKEIQTIVIDF